MTSGTRSYHSVLFVQRLVNFIDVVSINIFLIESNNLQIGYLFLICLLTMYLEILNLKIFLCFQMRRKAYMKNNIAIESKLE